MNYLEYKYLVRSDLYRYTGKITTGILLKNIRTNPGFKFSFWMRTCRYVSGIKKIRFFLMPLFRAIFYHYTYKYGIWIPYITEIGPGFYIGHFGGIVVSRKSKIGKNCNISQGVTIGQTNRGDKMGCPTIGDNVFIAPGAVIIGKIRVGDFSAVGANCVVTNDVPDHSVVVGIPGRVISCKGSEGYINRTDY